MSGKKTKNNDKQEKPPEIIGKAYDQLKDSVMSAAKSDIPILLIGERGSGKEVFAKNYMTHNDRTGPKMTINCAAVDEALLRPEIFGHVKGAFTDAKEDRPGKLIHCNGGILCLDELGDASEAFQAAILRVVEQNSFSKVGCDKEETDIDTLIIAATNKPQKLREEIKDRFNIFYVPPLQKGDIPALATYFFQEKTKKTDVFPKEDILNDLIAQEYPGNVRQLQKTCERLFSEHGSAVLGNRRPQPLLDVPPFDYERFVREYRFWFEWIQPVIEKSDLTYNLSYDYQPWGKPSYFGHERGDGMTSPFPNLDTSSLLQIIEEKPLNFILELKEIIANWDLPHFLQWMQSELNLNGFLPRQNAKPDLSPLLEMASPEQAVAEFKQYYYQNLVKKHDGDMEKAAQSLGLSKSALNQKIDRLNKKIISS